VQGSRFRGYESKVGLTKAKRNIGKDFSKPDRLFKLREGRTNMLEVRETPDSNIMEITVDGRITRADFDKAAVVLNKKIKEHGSLRLLEEVKSFGAVEPSMILEDLKWVYAHFKDITRAAVVTDRKWIELYTRIVKPFVKIEIRHFDVSEIEEARLWLSQA
ncbi:MAG: STAS/SEC14 domain-containing protein, partial [Desulfobacterales bacterium]